jgi:hypothetical protein
MHVADLRLAVKPQRDGQVVACRDRGIDGGAEEGGARRDRGARLAAEADDTVATLGFPAATGGSRDVDGRDPDRRAAVRV